jgi:hypothetical protein
MEQKILKIFNITRRGFKDFLKDDIFKIILATFEARSMFETLDEKKVDLNSIVDLR